MVGLLGVDAGLIWLVAGVWTVRRLWGLPLGTAWGIACIGAGLRWGTLTLGDVQAATALLGPTVVTDPPLAVAGAGLALAAALAGEAAAGGLRGPGLAPRLGAGIALVALVPLYCAPGPGTPSLLVSVGWWAGAGAGLAALVLLAAALARRIPGWLPPAAAAAGVLLMGVAR